METMSLPSRNPCWSGERERKQRTSILIPVGCPTLFCASEWVLGYSLKWGKSRQPPLQVFSWVFVYLGLMRPSSQVLKNKPAIALKVVMLSSQTVSWGTLGCWNELWGVLRDILNYWGKHRDTIQPLLLSHLDPTNRNYLVFLLA